MPSDSPFAGIKLSEQVASPPVDQQLFSPTLARTAKLAPLPPRALPNGDARKAVPAPPSAGALASDRDHGPTVLDVSGLDLLEEAVYKATFTFTREELNALDDLKMELNRRYDAGATKYNLIRCAVHMLVEDYATKGEQAYVRRKLRKRVA